MRDAATGKDEVLIDPHSWTADHSRSVSMLNISEDGSRLAYEVRQGGKDETEIRIFDVASRRDLPDVLAEARYFSADFSPDGQSLYYVRNMAGGPRLFRHRFGSPVGEDRELFGSGFGPETIMAAGLSEGGRYLLVQIFHGASGDKTELFVQDLSAGTPIQPIATDLDARFLGTFAGETLVILTNWQAPNSRILKVDLAHPGRDHWREIVPERKDAVIEAMTPACGRLFVNYLENVRSKVLTFDLEGKPLGELALETLGSASSVLGRWQSQEAFYSFQSFVVPEQIYRWDAGSGKSTVWARPSVALGSTQIEVEQVWFESKDSTRVPMFLVHAKGLALDASHPTYLTGYGGFNVNMSPFFSALAAIWVERGGVYAVPALRGGGEFGEAWHRAGMLEQKQHTFDDFIAAAEWLVRQRYTRPDRLAVSGGSNGGLLVGAFLTQRPDLARAVICSYPLLDMLRYHRFLVAQYWVPEYGSADNPKDLPVLAAYSPYHHVKPGTAYPAVLLVTGDGDTRVAPLHARKMAALLQSVEVPGRPTLLRYHTQQGHSGGEPVSQRVQDYAESVAFLRWQLGVAGGS